MDLFTEAEFFLPAGGQTTASAIAALFFYLMRYPDCYKRLMDEIRSAFTNGNEIINDKISACSYLHACIDEALRMSPPAPGTLWRESPTNTQVRAVVDGHLIPNGTVVGVNTYAIQHNEEYFGEPYTFKPERVGIQWGVSPQAEGTSATKVGIFLPTHQRRKSTDRLPVYDSYPMGQWSVEEVGVASSMDVMMISLPINHNPQLDEPDHISPISDRVVVHTDDTSAATAGMAIFAARSSLRRESRKWYRKSPL